MKRSRTLSNKANSKQRSSDGAPKLLPLIVTAEPNEIIKTLQTEKTHLVFFKQFILLLFQNLICKITGRTLSFCITRNL